MTTASDGTEGGRIRALFRTSETQVTIIAPFIKKNALKALLDVVPDGVHVRCVTRWRSHEVAAGVSDPEILDILEGRGSFSLSVVDELHAKLYVAGERCLAGSANVTLAGLGERADGGNIEVLVEASVSDPAIVATLTKIADLERPATRAMAVSVRRLADVLATGSPEAPTAELGWFPRSRRPERAFRYYSAPPEGFLGAADRLLLGDLAGADVPPGLSEGEFREGMRRSLRSTPAGQYVLDAESDALVTRSDISPSLEHAASRGGASPEDLWRAFVEWMSHFFPDYLTKQPVSDVALRRARLLEPK
ncbi:MAG: phospholipase D family protein [Acidobacteria bacterium]|nr:phospholipase D family protein [Acidobacteriota bacterium]